MKWLDRAADLATKYKVFAEYIHSIVITGLILFLTAVAVHQNGRLNDYIARQTQVAEVQAAPLLRLTHEYLGDPNVYFETHSVSLLNSRAPVRILDFDARYLVEITRRTESGSSERCLALSDGYFLFSNETDDAVGIVGKAFGRDRNLIEQREAFNRLNLDHTAVPNYEFVSGFNFAQTTYETYDGNRETRYFGHRGRDIEISEEVGRRIQRALRDQVFDVPSVPQNPSIEELAEVFANENCLSRDGTLRVVDDRNNP